FLQDVYKLDPCGAINEIKKFREVGFLGNQGCPPDVEEVFRELQTATGRGGILDGYIFAWALFNFSQDGWISQGKALEAPKPASEIARLSRARVTGEAPERAGKSGTDYILASCKECNSLIPAKIELGDEFILVVRRGDIDWRVSGDQAYVELKVRLILEREGQSPLVFEKIAVIKEWTELVISDAVGWVPAYLLVEDEVARIPTGTYQVSVYVKNLLTGKYNAWVEEFSK
ncbi:MAG: hypothetical protein Q7S36_02000, partial [Candidatus Liptonbacteria bacterium]|nr:hypothetical protein [Candidatus Liptonbacteria bacterium]